MPRGRIQEQHESMPNVSMRQYIGHYAQRNGLSVPRMDTMQGIVLAELYRGLWIARCPSQECAGACAVTSLSPVYCCPDCGAGWFEVIFPPNKAAIEKEVMKRPETGRGLIHANWDPYGGPRGTGESMALLREQTKAGIA